MLDFFLGYLSYIIGGLVIILCFVKAVLDPKNKDREEDALEMRNFDHLRTTSNTSSSISIQSDKYEWTKEEASLRTELIAKALEVISNNVRSKPTNITINTTSSANANSNAHSTDNKSQSSHGTPSKIRDDIYLGDHHSASNVNTYQNLGVTHVVNCAGGEYKKKYPSHVQVLCVNAEDNTNFVMIVIFCYSDLFLYLFLVSSYNIIETHLGDVITFVHHALSNKKANNKVLFHCLAGINRSAALCVAYLLNEKYQTQTHTTSSFSPYLLDVVHLLSFFFFLKYKESVADVGRSLFFFESFQISRVLKLKKNHFFLLESVRKLIKLTLASLMTPERVNN
ncbi:LRR and dual specificity phosphatase domain-containing protein [Reticulomyxa filosa]|uniref:protein-tyrosine-phosphatase n=1 Tax=Reticulomyxa filosa TaxID=46433 RepID=X6NN99_RETFI|nr:LRR and dual specificity phosphatase domain-containing protein [Reticulomyxa filosa]|eukprot:ETO27760.1 LRR and dual specificity phosphatase domain-containing protein [Reticulomyxa filosa]